MIGLSPRRRIWFAALVLVVALVATIVPADSLGIEEGYTFSYVVPPKPRTPAMGIRPIPRPPGPPPWARNATANQSAFSGASTTAAASSTGYETTGSMSAVVLAVDFDDNEASTRLSHYDDMLFDPAGYPDDITKSMRSYYHEVSYYDGAAGLDVTGEVYGKARSDPSDWVGWIRAPKSYKYYTSGSYGFGRYPKNAQKLTEDAVAAADPYVDFGAFTTYEGTEGGVSGTFVSALFAVHAGPGAEVTGSRNDIWSHAWVTREPIATDDTTADGETVYVYRYIMMAEDSPMGTFGHEFGHTLGLPDLYDYDGSSTGIGAWGMMAYGTWNDGGHTPAHMCAWSKIQAGWVSPTVIADTKSVDIPQTEKNATIYQLWTNSGGSIPEYFLVENRQKLLFDAALPGDGLLIWHIDDNVSNNDDETHYRVALEQADGNLDLENWTNAGDDGDPYPGGTDTDNRTFDETSTPNSRTYDGLASGVAVAGISDSGSTMTAIMTAGGDTPPSVSIVDPDEGQTVRNVYRVLVSAIDDNAVDKVELSIDGGEPYIDITYKIDGDYYYYDWDTTDTDSNGDPLYPDGSHTVTAIATDDALQTTSDSISVIVDNVNDPPAADAGSDQTVVDADEDGVESVTLDATGGGPIAFDAASSASTDPDSDTLSWSHTTSGSDRMMIVGVTTRNNRAVTSVTYGGVGFTKIRRDVLGGDVGTELWYLIAPPLGTQTVILTTEEATTIEAGATAWTGVGQTAATALGNDAGATGEWGETASVIVTSVSGEVVVDVVGTQHRDAQVTVGPGQTERWNQVGTAGVGAASSKPGAATVTMSWDLAKVENWSISAVALLSAGGSYDPDGTIVSYEWKEGDTVLGDTASITLDFSVGTHTVILTVTDDRGATDSDTVAVTVKPPSVPPVAEHKSVTTDEDTPLIITLTATDTQECDLTFTVVDPPAQGSLSEITDEACTPGSPNADSATVTYSPSADYNGSDSFTYKANDGTSDSDVVTVSIVVSAVNDAPVASFTYGCSGLTCDFDGGASTDPDGTIVSYEWDFGDGGDTSTRAQASHSYASAGTYTVILTVTDDGGATGTDFQDVTVSEGTDTIHVGDLDGSATSEGRTWTARVDITVHDASHNPLADVTVTGTWSDGASGVEDSYATDGNGQCFVEVSGIPKRNGSVTFTVTDVSHATLLTYDPSANHDPDPDSGGTSIIIYKPL